MPDILDLQALVPEPKKIKLHNGKLIDCFPLTIRQLVKVAKLEKQLTEVQTEDEIIELMVDALGPFIPAIKDDPEVDFTIAELWKIVRFAQDISVQEVSKETKEYAPESDPKKKVGSQKA